MLCSSSRESIYRFEAKDRRFGRINGFCSNSESKIVILKTELQFNLLNSVITGHTQTSLISCIRLSSEWKRFDYVTSQFPHQQIADYHVQDN